MALTHSLVTTENNQLYLCCHVQELEAAIHSGSPDLALTKESYIFLVANNVVLGALVTLFGITSNVINMIVFHKQGFTTTANISFFSLALSDFFCLLTYEGFNILINPLMDNGPILFVPGEFQHLIVGWLHVCFCRITSWTTVYITAERCLSVALPLKVKQIVSPRKTTACMCAIFAINLMTLSPEYCIAFLDWKFVPERNTTLIGLHYRTTNNKTNGVIYTLTSISGMVSFVAVTMLTTFLTIKLTQTPNWHNRVSSNDAHSEARSLRGKKTMKMVMIIATILIVCNIPGTIVSFTSVFEPEFVPSGQYTFIYFFVWSLAFLSAAINSSVNMLLYYNMSTKYRETFNGLLANCIKPININDNNRKTTQVP